VVEQPDLDSELFPDREVEDDWLKQAGPSWAVYWASLVGFAFVFFLLLIHFLFSVLIPV
jgi:hypothetical protein